MNLTGIMVRVIKLPSLSKLMLIEDINVSRNTQKNVNKSAKFEPTKLEHGYFCSSHFSTGKFQIKILINYSTAFDTKASRSNFIAQCIQVILWVVLFTFLQDYRFL